MYYHGTDLNHPCANGLHTFWVYPEGPLYAGVNARNRVVRMPNRWDTMIDASRYCNNHVYEGTPHGLKQYICQGHSNIQDMEVAQDDWKTRGFSTEVISDVNRVDQATQTDPLQAEKVVQKHSKIIDSTIYRYTPILLLSIMMYYSIYGGRMGKDIVLSSKQLQNTVPLSTNVIYDRLF